MTELLSAATAVFNEKGYHGASLQEIAGRVGIQKPSLYHHITGKKELLNLVVSRGIDLLTAAFDSLAATDLPPREKLVQAVTTHIRLLAEHRDAVTIALRDLSALDPEIRDAYIAKRDKYEQAIRKLIQDGIDCGVFRPVDVKLTAFAILGLCNSILTWYRLGGPVRPEKVAREFLDLICQGLDAK